MAFYEPVDLLHFLNSNVFFDVHSKDLQCSITTIPAGKKT